jgi:cysteine desulfurase
MEPYWNAAFGNAESSHFAGRLARRAVESARATVAGALGVDPGQVFFNSGATEGNNWIFQAFADAHPEARRIVVSAIEHKSVLNAAKRLEPFGFEVALLPVTPDGVVDLAAAHEAIRPGTGLVSVQLANNETGVVQPVCELAALAHEAGAFFHCDAVQALGKMLFSLADLGVDSAAFSAHKIHGPKGVGFLYLRAGANHFPFPKPLAGGGQERGVRPGTHNVPGIVGLGRAMELLPDATNLARLKAMRDEFESAMLAAIPGSRVNGAGAERLPNTTNLFIPGVPSEMLLSNMPLLCVSTGSACNSGVVDHSYVLKAMSISDVETGSSLRISSSSLTERVDYDTALKTIVEARRKILKTMQ